MRDAFDPVSGRFRNFRDADGTWLDAAGSEDSHGRAVLTLGVAVRDHPEAEFGANARMLFGAALPAATRLHALRATASTVLGCAAALDGPGLDPGLRDAATGALAKLSARLRNAFATAARDRDWPWPEPVLTYENALLPRALLVAGARTGDPDLSRLGLDALDWLNAVQTNVDGAFSPIGNDGFWRRGGPRARYDQQPIEATSMILAAEVAHAQTGEQRYLEIVERAYAWFLGSNDVGVLVADPATGGCFDGLEPAGVNRNQGAESTLMWLLALEHVRAVRRVATAPQPWHAGRPPGRRPVRREPRVTTVDPESSDLFQRHAANPILTVGHVPYRANSVFNPGAARVGDETVLLVRVEDLRGISHLVVARSRDGVTDWRFDAEPLLAPQPDSHPEEIWGCEDPA